MDRNAATSPEAVVQRQLDTYNAHDLEAWLATYAADARQYEHPGKLLATGHAEIRARAVPRFAEPNLHAALIRRTVMGAVVVDHETVTRTFREGKGHIDMVCIYVVTDGLIRTASFVFGPVVIDAKS
jgi:putative hydrolase of HD superfamily